MLALVPAFVAGCGGNGLDPILGSPGVGNVALTDTSRPTVVLTVPAAGAPTVPINTKITVTFSEAMDPASIRETSFTLTNTTIGSAVPGAVSYSVSAKTAYFTPTAGVLAANSQFTATVTSAATDLAGNALAGNTAVIPNAGNHLWTFATGAASDLVAPTVVNVSPPDASTGVCLTKATSATQNSRIPRRPAS